MRALVLLCVVHGIFGAAGAYSWNGPGTTGASENDWCKSDDGSCGCCAMVKELDQLKKHFDVKMETLRKDYQQTKQSLTTIETNRTAFSVALFDQFRCFGPFRTNVNVIYEHVFINQGNAYSATTGIFTVIYAGVYSITLTVYSDAGAASNSLAACAKLRVNGVAVASTTDVNRNDQEDSATIAVALHLKLGDQVTVSLPPGCFLCDNNHHYNTFSAFLLYLTA